MIDSDEQQLLVGNNAKAPVQNVYIQEQSLGNNTDRNKLNH